MCWKKWLVLWVLCSLAALAAHSSVGWFSEQHPALHGIFLPLARLLWLPCSPFSAMLWVSGIGASIGLIPVWIIASMLGWGLIIGTFAMGSVLRQRWCARATPCSTIHAGRRQFLMNAGSGMAAISLSSVGSYGSIIEPQRLQLRRYRIPIRDLPAALDGLRIVQLSDTHVGRGMARSFIDRAVRDAIDLKPDLFVLTGDQLESRDGHIESNAEAFAPLCASTTGAMGVIGVLGNHDWYGDGPAVRRSLNAIGIRMIDNDHLYIDAATRRLTSLTPADPAAALCIVGVGDLISNDTDIEAAFRSVPRSAPRLLLTHEPDTLELAALGNERVDLALCGHTHGGQVRLPFLGAPIIPSQFGQKYEGGLVQSPVGPVIVSRGIGTSGIPVRFGVPPELVEITLVRADGRA